MSLMKNPFLLAAIEAARAGEAVIRRYYNTGVKATLKQDASPVTVADVESERAIRALLEARFPDHGFYGEETGSRARDADYLSCGPMFATALKPRLPAKGLSYWDAAVKLGRPVFAIGGITAERLPELVRRGVDRIAVCAGVIGRRDVASAARRLRSALNRP